MLNDAWLFLLILLAIIIGWLLGRRSQLTSADNAASLELNRRYYQGLNYLLNDKPDGALDSFIQALDVNSETLETHLAIGNLMRRKGEVERAIRIHQNLLARPSLSQEHLHQAHLELSRDYISAGLLDRAESLLLDLAQEAPELKEIAIHHLLEIYQDEREWQQAIETAKQLLPKKLLIKSLSPESTEIIRALAHFHCELAERQFQKNNMREARAYLKDALSYDRDCVRASLILGRIESQTGHYPQAVKAYRKVFQQNPKFVPEIIEPLKQCYQQLNKADEYHQFLRDCVARFPSSATVLALMEWIREQQGEEQAADFISQELTRRPSLRGLFKLVELHLDSSSGRAKENLEMLQLLIKQLLQEKPNYQCKHCGFSGKQLHWLCPGCKQWGEVEYIRGAEGD
jgi:lipopolysaccharide biosynthesis regulator YciM